MDSGARLRELMAALDKNAEDVSKETGLPKSSISMWLNKNRSMRADKIGIIADRYGVDPAWLLGYDVPMYRDEAGPQGKIVKNDNPSAFAGYMKTLGWDIRQVEADLYEISDESVAVRVSKGKYLGLEDKIKRESTNAVLKLLSESLSDKYRNATMPIAAHGDNATEGQLSEDYKTFTSLKKKDR